MERLGSITAEQLLEQSSDDTHVYELEYGRLIVREPPGYRHGQVAANLFRRLDAHVHTAGLGRVGFDPGFVLHRDPDCVRAPDVAFIAKDKTLSGRAADGYAPFAPDFAAEVMSPNNREEHIAAKVRDYLAFGTQLVWVLYPRKENVLVHRPRTGVCTLRGADQLT